MALGGIPITLKASGGWGVTEAINTKGLEVTIIGEGGLPVTIMPSGGFPVTFTFEDGTPNPGGATDGVRSGSVTASGAGTATLQGREIVTSDFDASGAGTATFAQQSTDGHLLFAAATGSASPRGQMVMPRNLGFAGLGTFSPRSGGVISSQAIFSGGGSAAFIVAEAEPGFAVYDPLDMSEAPVTSFSVDVDALGSTYAADSLSPHATNRAGVTASHNFWTSPSFTYKYASADPATYYTAKGRYYSRDQGVKGYCRIGEVFLRLVGGKAWCFSWNFESTGFLTISLKTGLVESVSQPPGGSANATYFMWSTDALTSLIGGGYTNGVTNGHQVKCACEGLDVVFYYSFDSSTFTEIVRVKPTGVSLKGVWTPGSYATWLHMVDGAPAIGSIASVDHGWRDFTMEYDDTPQAYYSNWVDEIDVRDFGVKDFQTTGTMTSAGWPNAIPVPPYLPPVSPVLSYSLTVADASGLNVNDNIIIEPNGAVGAGATGTRGPGGAFPTLYFTNQAAMLAYTTAPQHTLCYLQDTGFTYRWNIPTPGWVRVLGGEDNDYIERAIPLALRARITAKSGNVLTLDTYAQTAVTNSNVYFDNAPIFNALWPNNEYNVALQPFDWIFPNSRIPVSYLNQINARSVWSYSGAGSGIPNSTPTGLTNWFAPRGCPSPQMIINNSPVIVRGMHFTGGAYFAYPQLGFDTMEQNLFVATFPGGVQIVGGAGSLVDNIKCTQVWQKAVDLDNSSNVHVTKCLMRGTEFLRTYVQWYFSSANCYNDCSFTDCEMDADFMVPGWETFLDGIQGTGTTFRRQIMRNATASNNSSGGSLFTDCRVLLTENSRANERSYSKFNPVVNINSNIANQSGGGVGVPTGTTVHRLSLVAEGYNDVMGEQHRGIIVDGSGGTIITDCIMEMLPYFPGSITQGAQGVVISQVNVEVDNCTVTGTTIADYRGNIESYAVGDVNVTNCDAPRIVLDATNTQSGNTGAVTVGGVLQTPASLPSVPDRTPAPLNFVDVMGAEPNTQYISNEVQITGTNRHLQGMSLSPTGKFIWTGEDSGADGQIRDHDHWMLTGYGGTTSLIRDGDYLRLVATSAPLAGQQVLVRLYITPTIAYDWLITSGGGSSETYLLLTDGGSSLLLVDGVSYLLFEESVEPPVSSGEAPLIASGTGTFDARSQTIRRSDVTTAAGAGTATFSTSTNNLFLLADTTSKFLLADTTSRFVLASSF